jgi:hypothetical protein
MKLRLNKQKRQSMNNSKLSLKERGQDFKNKNSIYSTKSSNKNKVNLKKINIYLNKCYS